MPARARDVDRASRQRRNRRLWAAFIVVLVLQLWPLRELGNRIEPFVGPLPFTVVWHLVGVIALVTIYLLWMSRVWLPTDEDVDVPGEDS